MSRTTSCNSVWRTQFSLKFFVLGHRDVSCFAKSQWGEHVLPMALLRTVLFLYTLGIQIYAPFTYKMPEKFLIYATNWGYLAIIVGLFISSVNTWVYYFQRSHYEKNGYKEIGWNVKLQWVVTNIYTTTAFVVTLLFWIFVFQGGVVFLNFNTHAVNLMIVLLELFVSRAPTRLLHLYQPTLYMLTYAIFTIIYWKAGGTDDNWQHYIYSVIDYDNKLKSGLALIFATALLVAPVLHLVVFLFYTLRITIWRGCCSRHADSASDDPGDVIMM